jgi:hypothetical protein
MLPIFCHHVNDEERFRLFCCQLINLGTATSAQIAKILEVNPKKLSRWARLERASNSKISNSEELSKKSKNNKKKTMS